MDVLSKCVDFKDDRNEVTKGGYAEQLMEVIRAGICDRDGHKYTQYLIDSNPRLHILTFKYVWSQM